MVEPGPQTTTSGQEVAVTCVLFAGVRDAVGTDRIELTLPAGSTVRQLRERLLRAYPRAAALLRVSRLAVDADFVDDDAELRDGVEVAVIPPVSGGAGETRVALTEAPIDPAEWLAAVYTPAAGAVVTFLGTVREFTGERRTRELEYEAYREMTERKLREIGDAARVRFGLTGVVIVHRLGLLKIGEISVFIAVSSPHRAQAFDGCRFIIEAIKKDVPIWKKEIWADGSYEWVHPGMESSGGTT